MEEKKEFVIGVDFGTDSVRAVLVDTVDGSIISTSVFEYPRWKEGIYCEPSQNQFRQDPKDHLEGLEFTIKEVVKGSQVETQSIKGIGIDTTGSSPMPITNEGIPLAFLEEFKNNPHAQVILWKDHTAIQEAQEITHLAHHWGGDNFTKYSGGIYSSEWFWAKILKTYRCDLAIESYQPNWVEHCDYISGELTGTLHYKLIKRSRCAAGHKAMWHESWGGFPSKEFLEKLNPSLGILKDKLSEQTYTAEKSSGNLSPFWAEKLGLPATTSVSIGTLDAHAGAVGAGIQEGTLVKVMGTSTCDMLVAPYGKETQKAIKGISGQVDGSIVPGFIGYEAGQAGFGDLLAWLKELVTQPVLELIESSNAITSDSKAKLKKEIEEKSWLLLAQKAQKSNLQNGPSRELVLDWINGRRSPDVNERLRAAITGIGMGTGVGELFKGFVESLCFGSKRIIERFQEEGVQIRQVVGVGGIAKKSPYLVQTMADILEVPIKVVESEQTPALGAAIYGAVASGIFLDYPQASQRIASGTSRVFYPQVKFAKSYRHKYMQYLSLGDFIEYEKESDKE